MSWLSSNYEKALLGAALLLALTFAWFGWSRLNHSDEDFEFRLRGSGKNIAAVEGSEEIAKAMQSMDLDHGWKQGNVEGRMVDLFTGIPMFIRSGQNERAIDLLKGKEVHPPIPNSWWLDNNIDPGFADSPQRDPDGDGFSNLEEYRAKTDPNDPADHPELIAKLRYLKDDTVTWLLDPGFLDAQGAMPLTYIDRTFKDGKAQVNRNKAGAGAPIAPGQKFFATGHAQGRFKFIGHEVVQQKNEATGITEDITMVVIEDQQANKLGTKYKIPAPLKSSDEKKYYQYDRAAIMVLEALGRGSQEIRVDENTRFGLPADAKEKPYLLKSVTEKSIVIEYPDEDGQVVTIEIARGALPLAQP